MAITRLFRTNRTQAVRLPKDVAFPDDGEVSVTVEGTARIVTPVHSTWDRFFDSIETDPLDIPDRRQPAPQERDWS